MKYFALILGFQFIVVLGFSQEKKDTIVKASTPQPARIAVSQTNSTKSSIKQKTPENKRVTEADIIRNKAVNNKAKKPENLRIKNN